MLYHPITLKSSHESKITPITLDGNLFLAPVAGYTDRAFRELCIKCGADFTFTEMVSSEALVRGSEKTSHLMEKASNEDLYAVQLFGGVPSIVASAAKMVFEQYKPAVLDINAGCPVPKIIKSGAGSVLTQNPKLLGQIIGETVKELSAYAEEMSQKQGTLVQPPFVTVKIRSGWDEKTITWKQAAQSAIEAGCAMVSFHPRTRAQGYSGFADWSLLQALSEFVHAEYPEIPVIGSGDLFKPEGAKKMLSETNCDGVMFARGAMGNPFVFFQTKELLKKGAYSEIDPATRMSAGFSELKSLVLDVGEAVACREMRKRFCAYSKGVDGGAILRQEIVSSSTIDDFYQCLSKRNLLTDETDNF